MRAAVLAGVMGAALVSFTAPAAMAEGDPTITVKSNDSDTLLDMDKCAEHTDNFRFRFYYHKDYKGAWVNVGHPVWDLKYIDSGVDPAENPLRFCGDSDGGGQPAANNSASAYNWYDQYCAYVYYSKGYGGASERIAPHSGGNLGATANNNRSITFGKC
ncbi:hypothetical protein [Kitasatospora sp. NPDC093558]|uniref:hypothetical protein n=1 Tax=Kitasatospora sp. NPDC093558 TaxID=3155201 RepID=UPI0034245F40